MNKYILRNKRSTVSKSKKHSYRLFLAIGILLLACIFLFGNHGLIRYFQLQRQKQKLIQQISELKAEQEKLQHEINLLQNNYRYIEKIAREKYQMGKDGEKIFFMIQPTKNNKRKN